MSHLGRYRLRRSSHCFPCILMGLVKYVWTCLPGSISSITDSGSRIFGCLTRPARERCNDAPSDFVRQLVRIKKGLQGPVIEVGNLKPRRAFLDVRDTVRGFYLAAMKGKPGESYNLCAASTHEVGTLLRAAIQLSGVRAEIRVAHHLMRPSDEKIIFGSTRKFFGDTGWKPMFSLEETLSSMLEYWEKKL